MGVKYILYSLATATLFQACQSSSMTKGVASLDIEASLAESKAQEFFAALQKDDHQKLLALYPAYQQLENPINSETASLHSITEKGTMLIITMRNVQRSEKGFRMEKDVKLLFQPDAGGQLVLVDSKGLAAFEKKEEYQFALKTGCISLSRDTTDQLLAKGLAKARLLLPEKAFAIYTELKQGIQITDWNWEPGDNGSAFGEGIVHNSSLYTLPELKYKITYQNNNGDTLATDKGNVSYETVQPGDNPSFTFYTSYVGKPSKAVIELLFDDDLVFGFLSKKEWTGKECEEFFKKTICTNSSSKMNSFLIKMLP